MTSAEPDTEALIARAAEGEADARNQLLLRHRGRLRDLIALRLDRRLRARVDPSDVVQESLAEADRKLDGYLADRPLPFFLWLRELALEQLVVLHRRHVKAQKRSVTREAVGPTALPDESVLELANRLAARGSSPSGHLQEQERREHVHAALARLSERDREVLALRHLEQLSVVETATVLGISEGAVKVRHLRALQRLGMELREEELP